MGRRARKGIDLPQRHRGHGVSDSEGKRTVGGPAVDDYILLFDPVFPEGFLRTQSGEESTEGN